MTLASKGPSVFLDKCRSIAARVSGRLWIAILFCSALIFLPLFLYNSVDVAIAAFTPNVILITIDTLRADHLACYGYKKVRTPNIDRLAAEGIRFTTVVTAAPLTLPSHCSILTGTYPMFHGVRDNVGYRLDPSKETLSQILKRRGYRTGAFVGAYVLDRAFGLGTGFDFYYDDFNAQTNPARATNMGLLKRKGSEVIDHALEWIGNGDGRPFFIWVHLYDPHDPYDPPAPFRSEYPTRPYDGEIAYVDQQVGRLVAFLKQKSLYGNTTIVLTGDHGESLGEHREIRHGYFIYDATLLVPLIIKPLPDSMKANIVTQQVRSIDIAPTILQMVGLPNGKSMQGSGLVDLMLGKEKGTPLDAYSESFYPRQFGWSALRSIRSQNVKYIEAPKPELYELDTDSKELTNKLLERQAIAAQLRAKLRAIEERLRASGQEGKSSPLTPEETEKLGSLGYVAHPRSAAGAQPSGEFQADPKDKIDTFYLINRAGIDVGRGNCNGAIATLQEVIRKDPRVPAAHAMLGRCYFILEHYDAAEKSFLQVLRIDPQSTEAEFYIAASQFNLDQLDSAERGFEKVLVADPRYTYAHKYLGFVYQTQGRTEQAIKEFEKVLETSPDDLESHGKLGFLLASTSRPREALPHLQKVVELIPSDASAHYNLGLAYQKLGQNASAAKQLSLACKLDSTFCGR